jgi:hypothetical protein
MAADETRFNFRLGEAFPPDDEHARYVMRLSMAMGDLRVVVPMLGPDIGAHERLFFVRLLTALMREATTLIDPPGKAPFPSLDAFLAPFDASHAGQAVKLREARRRVLDKLDQKLASGRTLRSELADVRNGFFHYLTDRDWDGRLRTAMRTTADMTGVFVNRPEGQRARYADAVAASVTFPGALGDEQQQHVVEIGRASLELLDPLTEFIGRVEWLWLYTRGRGVVLKVHPDGTHQAL